MIQNRPWKIVLVLLAFAFGLVFTLPNLLPTSVVASMPSWASKRLNLGLDLQGGSYLLLEVDTDALRKEELTNLVEDARRTLQTANINFTGLGVANPGAPNASLQVRVTSPAQVDAARDALGKLAQPTLAGGRDLSVNNGPDQTLVMSYSAEAERQRASQAVDQSIEILRRRIDALGTREPTIIRQGANRIVVEAPGESDPEKLKSVIGQTAKLTFQLLDDTTDISTLAGHVPPEDELLPSENPAEAAGVLVRRRVIVSGADLTDAQPGFDSQSGQPNVNLRFNGKGGQAFGALTAANIGHRFAIVLDGKIITDPVIQSAILGGSGQITGSFTQDGAASLALLLRSGALPAPLHVEEQRSVGAELGADAVHAGQLSLTLGAVLIFVFIIATYGLFGVFAAVALVVNGLLIVGLLSIAQGTLTLPGIAGLILTLAVAVDANVLIYERMRDEARAGRSPLLAADNGYKRAIVTILDANITTLIAAAIMFQFGTGEVKGFALTLAIGVCTSVFTAVLITQVLIGWWFRAAKPKTLPIL
ncbi:MAG: protein translocase subunit SecD [Caulobacteraceae bacterium]